MKSAGLKTGKFDFEKSGMFPVMIASILLVSASELINPSSKSEKLDKKAS